MNNNRNELYFLKNINIEIVVTDLRWEGEPLILIRGLVGSEARIVSNKMKRSSTGYNQ